MVNSRGFYWSAIAFLASIYVLLVAGSPLTVRGWSNHDDLHFLRMAAKLLETGWFGPYNHFILMKGPFYPIFIAANFLLGLPILLTTHLFFVGTCIAVAGVLRLYDVPRPAVLLCYAVTLLHPISFVPEAFTTLRTEIYLPLTLAVVAGWLALPTAAARWRLPSVVALGVATGVAVAAFWLTREEGLWLVPALIAFAAGFCVLYWRRDARAALRRYAIGLATTLAVFVTANLAVSAVNFAHYRYFGTVDMRAPGYTGAYQALVRVRSQKWQHHFPLPQEARERVYAVSPAFRSIRPWLEPSGFKAQGCNFEYIRHTCGDFASGWFLWALRDAVAGAGHYTSGDRAEAFYRRLADEVNGACESRALDCQSPGFGFVPALSWPIVGLTIESMKEAIRRVVFIFDLHGGPGPGSGPELFPYVAALTHNRLAPTPRMNETPYGSTEGETMHSNGWVYHPDGPVELRLEAGPGQWTGIVMRRAARPDIVALFKDPRAAMAGFDVRYQCQDPCSLVLRTASGLETRVPVPRNASNKGMESNRFSVAFDVWSSSEGVNSAVRLPPPATLLREFDTMKIVWRARLVTAYRRGLPVALVIAVAALVWLAWRWRVEGTVGPSEPLLLLGFLAAAVLTRTVLLALLNAVLTAPTGLSYNYMSPSFTLYVLALAACVSLPFVRNSEVATEVSPARERTARKRAVEDRTLWRRQGLSFPWHERIDREGLYISFVVPCYNEEDAVADTLSEITRCMTDKGKTYEIVVIDDCSTDRTSDRVVEFMNKYPHMPVSLRRNLVNQGWAQNFIDGAFISRGKFYRMVPGDNVESAEEMAKVVALAGTADIVIPYQTVAEGKSPARMLLSKIFTFLVNALSGNKLRYYNGCSLYYTFDIMRWHVATGGYGFQAETLTRLLSLGFSYVEVGVRAQDRVRGTSKAINLVNVFSAGHSLSEISLQRMKRFLAAR